MQENLDNSTNNRLFNYRPTVVVLISCVVAIILAGLLIDVHYAYLIIIAISLLAIVLLIVFRNKVKYHKSLIISCICLSLLFCYTTSLLSMTYETYDIDVVNATVRINYVSQDGEVVIGSVTIADTQLSGQADIISMPNYFDVSAIETGQVYDCVISLKSNQSIYAPLSYNSEYFVQDIRYVVEIDRIIAVDTSPLTILESIRGHITNLLYNVLSDDEAGISLALIIGDKYNISYETKSAFSLSGLSHVLAISGLHVSILASIFAFFLSRTKLGIKKSSIISIFVALAYTFISGFAPSSLRALIMYAMGVLSYVFVKHYDQLSSMAFSAIVILFINPMYLYYLGFLMSYSAVLGITLFASNIANSRSFERLPKWIRDILATSLAVNITMMPIMADVFGSISVISLLANIVVLPIMSILMTLLMISIIVVTILPFLNFLLYIPSVLVYYLEYVAIILGNTAISTVKLSGMGWLSLPYYSTLVISSDYCGVSRRVKMVSTWLACIIIVSFVVVSSIVL